MQKKENSMFTQNEYDLITEAWDDEVTFTDSVTAVIRKMSELKGLVKSDDMSKVISLGNPDSRAWAYNRYVEKEKKYIWLLNGLYLERDWGDDSIIFNNTSTPLTESEIKHWGYNADMFEKEEV